MGMRAHRPRALAPVVSPPSRPWLSRPRARGFPALAPVVFPPSRPLFPRPRARGFSALAPVGFPPCGPTFFLSFLTNVEMSSRKLSSIGVPGSASLAAAAAPSWRRMLDRVDRRGDSDSDGAPVAAGAVDTIAAAPPDVWRRAGGTYLRVGQTAPCAHACVSAMHERALMQQRRPWTHLSPLGCESAPGRMTAP